MCEHCVCVSVTGRLVGEPGFWPCAQRSGSRRPASWAFPSQRPRGPLTHTPPRRSPPSFKLYLIFSRCGSSDSLWVCRSCSHSFIPNWGSNGEVFAGNLSSRWVMSRLLLSCVCSSVCTFSICVHCPASSGRPGCDPVSDVSPPLVDSGSLLLIASDQILERQIPPLGLFCFQPNSPLIRSDQVDTQGSTADAGHTPFPHVAASLTTFSVCDWAEGRGRGEQGGDSHFSTV